MVKEYLLTPTSGFINKYGSNYNVELTPDNKNNTLHVAVVINDEVYQNFDFIFSSNKKIITYICLSLFVVGIIFVIGFTIVDQKSKAKLKSK